jgi:hypothetical protein
MPKRKQIGHKASVERPNSFIKKAIAAIFGIGILMYPLICFSSYIIHLKDGKKVATDRYYEEGDQLKFKIFGGVMGIQKDQVKEIEEIEDVEKRPVVKVAAKPETPAEKADAGKKEGEKAGAVNTETSEQKEAARAEKTKGKEQEKEKPQELSEEEKKKAEQEENAKIQAYLEEKKRIMDEKEKAYLAFKEAKAKDDRAKKDEQWKKLSLIKKELASLRKKVMTEYGGKLPPWWTLWDR